MEVRLSARKHTLGSCQHTGSTAAAAPGGCRESAFSKACRAFGLHTWGLGWSGWALESPAGCTARDGRDPVMKAPCPSSCTWLGTSARGATPRQPSAATPSGPRARAGSGPSPALRRGGAFGHPKTTGSNSSALVIEVGANFTVSLHHNARTPRTVVWTEALLGAQQPAVGRASPLQCRPLALAQPRRLPEPAAPPRHAAEQVCGVGG
jgi:hypothetical protein